MTKPTTEIETIGPLTEEDWPALMHLCEAAGDVPSAAWLAAMQQAGSLLLGAWIGGRLAASSFAFIARAGAERAAYLEQPFYLHSALLYVLPEFRDQRLAYRLKLAQFEHARAHGYGLITWDFAPLHSQAAYLSLARLGGVARFYQPPGFGRPAGLACEWWLNAKRVEARLSPRYFRRTLDDWRQTDALFTEAARTPDGSLLPHDPHAVETGWPTVLLEIPPQPTAAAEGWPPSLEALLPRLFEAGFVAADFISEGKGLSRRSFYIFQKNFVLLKL